MGLAAGCEVPFNSRKINQKKPIYIDKDHFVVEQMKDPKSNHLKRIYITSSFQGNCSTVTWSSVWRNSYLITDTCIGNSNSLILFCLFFEGNPKNKSLWAKCSLKLWHVKSRKTLSTWSARCLRHTKHRTLTLHFFSTPCNTNKTHHTQSFWNRGSLIYHENQWAQCFASNFHSWRISP